MGKSSSAGSQEPEAARRTIRFTFTATVAFPATCLILLWALAAGAVLGSSLHGHGFWSPDHREVLELTMLVGAGLLIGLVCVILMGRFSAKLSRDIADPRRHGPRSADEQLPQLLERLRSGDMTPAAPPSRRSPGRGRRTRRSPRPSRRWQPGADRDRGGRRRGRAAQRPPPGVRQPGPAEPVTAAAAAPADRRAGAQGAPTPPRWPTCSRWTTSPPGCAATRKAWPSCPGRRPAGPGPSRCRSSTSSGPPWRRSRTTAGSRCSPRPRTRWPPPPSRT